MSPFPHSTFDVHFLVLMLLRGNAYRGAYVRSLQGLSVHGIFSVFDPWIIEIRVRLTTLLKELYGHVLKVLAIGYCIFSGLDIRWFYSILHQESSKELRNGDEITSPTHLKNWFYLRVSFEIQSLYSKFGNCFHKTMTKEGQELNASNVAESGSSGTKYGVTTQILS